MITTPQHNLASIITVFGDREDREVTKLIWSFLPNQDISIETVDSIVDVEDFAVRSLMVFVVLEGIDDPNVAVVQRFVENKNIVCSVVALVRDASYEERRKIMANGFDSIFPLDFVKEKDFLKIFQNKIAKGKTRIKNKIMEEEYRTFRATLAASAVAFIVFDNNRKLFYVSEHYLKAYPSWGHKLVRGIDVKEAYNFYCDEEGFTEDNPNYHALSSFWDRLEGECDYHREDGRVYRLRARPLPDDQGTIVITTNITDYINQQEELRQKSGALVVALEKEKEAGEIQKHFINMVSHEFRTPLSLIDGHAQIIRRKAGESDQTDLIDRTKIIRSAVSRLVNLMEGVLSSSMLKTGNLDLVPEQIDLKLLINDLCETHTTLSNRSKIIIDSSELPEFISLDKKVLTLAFGNLLSNAIKFSDENAEIKVSVIPDREGITLSISDGGVGIPEHEIEKIFDRYYRATTSKNVPGTGIGLNLVRNLVQLHNGDIHIDSVEGQGTTVTVYLPELK